MGFFILGILWLTVVIGGLVAMERYEFSSGDDTAAPAHWPDASSIPRAEKMPTLVVFAHPRCPCTSATLEELAAIMASEGASAKVCVLFFDPAETSEEWMHSATIRQAAAIPGVTLLMDKSGKEAQRFHAATSGRTLLYSAKGELLFDGGITGSRGHPGKNAGGSAVVSLLTKGTSGRANTPVYGCKIYDSSNCFQCPR